jgi:putative hydrolase of the HAD superfamily
LKPKAVLFDLDGTLFDRDSCFLELVQEQYDAFPDALAHVPRQAYVHRIVELDGHGYVDKTTVYREAAREFKLSTTTAERLRQHFHERYRSHCRSFPEVAKTLEKLRENGFQLGIITNGSIAMQEHKIRQLGIAELMDAILISEREGVRKPNAEIFERALSRLGVAADETWFVGDHPISDVKGAFDAGLTAVWKYTPYWTVPNMQAMHIQTLDELVQILERTDRESST